MRLPTLLLTLAFAAPAGALTVDEIAGTWAFDAQAMLVEMKKSPEFAQMPPEQAQMMEAMMVPALSKARITIGKDTISSVSPTGENEVRKILSFDSTGAKTATIKVEEKDPTQEAKPAAIEMKADGSLSLVISGQQGATQTLLLKRSAPEAAVPAAPVPAPKPK